MKQKMKKCLCLTLSFVFVLSNCTQLFAQAVPSTGVDIKATIPEELLTKVTEDMKSVKHNLKNLQFYADKVLKQSQFAEIEPYVLERYEKYLKEVEDLYTSVINRTVSYNKYLNSPWLDGTGASKTIISRAARKYSYNAPRLVVNNRAALEEGAAIKAIREEIGKVIDLGPKGVNYAANTAKVEKKMKSALNFLSERIEYYDYMLKGTPKAQEVLAGRVDELIAEGVITRERILSHLSELAKSNPEEFRFLGVLKEVKAGSLHTLDLSKAWRQYLKTIASKRAKAPVLGLMRHMSYETLISQLSPKHKKLIQDFPELIRESNYKYGSRKIWFKGATGPVMVIGIILTTALITQIKADNTFSLETISNRRLAELQTSIETNTAGIADKIMFYSNPQSDKLTSQDTKHFINSITLGMNLEEADKNFDVIDNILSEEALAANYDINTKLQNTLDEHLANINNKVAQDVGMI